MNTTNQNVMHSASPQNSKSEISNSKDTICAISTPAGRGGIAVLRLSGPQAVALAERHLSSTLADHRAKVCLFSDADGLVDEVVATLFAAPHSYTCEDVVELSCHGSVYIQQRILQALTASGARLAEPGEFTLRAFMGGRLNLSQAEAVADLIDSQSAASHQLALSQMRGGYADKLASLRRELIDATALLELELDFSEEDVVFAGRDRLLAMVQSLENEVRRLIVSFRTGNALKRGVAVAIAGQPNVGKSTLLNAILDDDRAIVSAEAGTTRDTIEELFTVGGILFRLIDTAGIRATDNDIERQGIDRSLRAMAQADIVLYLVDNNDTDVDVQLAAIARQVDLTDKHLIVLRNKMDQDGDFVNIAPAAAAGDAAIVENFLPISAKRGDNIDRLLQLLVETVRPSDLQTDVMVTSARHLDALQHLESALAEVEKGLAVDLTPDLLVVDLRDALYHLGIITGVVTNDDILASVFSRFCVGK